MPDPLRDFTAHVQGYAIFTLDADGRVHTWNDGARILKGYAAEEIIGAPYERFFTPEDLAAGRPGQILAAAREAGQHSEEGWRVRKDGGRFWAHVLITAIHHDDGALAGYGKITEDLTDKRSAQVELERYVAELERFAYVASHDLSEPLRTISGYADVLRRRHREELSPPARRFIDKIVGATGRMQELIDDLLAYSRAGRRGLEPAEVDLSELVVDALEGLAGDDADVRIGPLPHVRGDRVLLAQAVGNLLSNALKFSEGPPRVEVTAEESADAVTLLIADRGIGIAEEHLERAFELFQRLHPRDEYGGTGLGLAISRRVAERHRGTLTARQRDGGGTVMRLRLPR